MAKDEKKQSKTETEVKSSVVSAVVLTPIRFNSKRYETGSIVEFNQNDFDLLESKNLVSKKID